MARNVEFKAQLNDIEAAHRVAATLSGQQQPQCIDQHDIFYRCPHGRLKLRLFGGDYGELIQYHRPDRAEARLSDYVIAPTTQASALDEALRRGLGVLGEVVKTRWLYLVGQTRVHIDEVRDLGTFMELEVVLTPEQSQADGETIAGGLMREFGISPDHILAQAYIDLLMHKAAPAAPAGR